MSNTSLTIVLGFLTTFLSTFFGTVAGWFVGLFFGHPILHVLAACGITGVKVWEVGCFLGFVCNVSKIVSLNAVIAVMKIHKH